LEVETLSWIKSNLEFDSCSPGEEVIVPNRWQKETLEIQLISNIDFIHQASDK
jgi:hypothetical protein